MCLEGLQLLHSHAELSSVLSGLSQGWNFAGIFLK